VAKPTEREMEEGNYFIDNQIELRLKISHFIFQIEPAFVCWSALELEKLALCFLFEQVSQLFF